MAGNAIILHGECFVISYVEIKAFIKLQYSLLNRDTNS